MVALAARFTGEGGGVCRSAASVRFFRMNLLGNARSVSHMSGGSADLDAALRHPFEARFASSAAAPIAVPIS